mgnify:CR=1 FL=1
MIYLDAASTTQPKQEVIEAMIPYLTDKWYNPSALYSKANKIKDDIENARKTIGDFINANSNEIFFLMPVNPSVVDFYKKICYNSC